MQTGSNLETAKIYNERLVLDLIRSNGRLSRSELARRTALTPPTVSNIINSLLEQELVMPVGQTQGRRGSPSTLFSLNPAGALSVGVNLDQDRASGVLLNLAGDMVAEYEREVDPRDETRLHRAVRDILRYLSKAAGFDAQRLWGVGVGLPAGLVGIDALTAGLLEDVAAVLGDDPSIYVQNNATAAALGEYWYGEGSRFETFFYVLFGQGIGGGIVSGGSAHRGAFGFAGEIGRMPVQRADGLTVLEDIVSLRTLYDALRIEPGNLSRRERIEIATRLAADDGPAYRRWLEAAVEHLGNALVQVECLLDPDAIILGGSLPDPVMVNLLPRLSERLARLRQPTGKPHPAAIVQGRAGDRAGSLGAAILPLYETIAPTIELLQKRPAAHEAQARES